MGVATFLLTLPAEAPPDVHRKDFSACSSSAPTQQPARHDAPGPRAPLHQRGRKKDGNVTGSSAQVRHSLSLGCQKARQVLWLLRLCFGDN